MGYGHGLRDKVTFGKGIKDNFGLLFGGKRVPLVFFFLKTRSLLSHFHKNRATYLFFSGGINTFRHGGRWCTTVPEFKTAPFSKKFYTKSKLSSPSNRIQHQNFQM
jgi:hypothetical protein